jgi:hypothetical protein
MDEKRRRIPRQLLAGMLIASALTVLSCGLCCRYASQTPIAADILNLPRSATDYEPDRRTTATLWTDKVNYKQDEPIHIRFTVKNTSGMPLALEREDGPVMDLAVLFLGDREPYRWSELHPDQMQALHRLELQPGEEHTIEWVFKDHHKQPVCPEFCGSVEVLGYWQWANGELRQVGSMLGYGL